MDLKVHRDNEEKLHEHLYNNLYMLSHVYPTSTDFKRIFRKDMFVKSNKAAFFEVVYYLFSILNPELTKEKITMWPPYDIKRENKFRTEVLSFVNQINILYDYADIPNVVQSHLISPGGFKFTKFMLKLSELVVFQHLKRHGKVELYSPRPNSNFDFHTAYVKQQTTAINFTVNTSINKSKSLCAANLITAQKIVDNLTEINNTIVEEKKKNEKTREEFNKQYPSYPSLKSLYDKTQILSEEWCNLRSVPELFSLCGNLIKYLNSNSVVLEYKKEKCKIPSEIIHIVKNSDVLNLSEFFQGLNILLKQQALDLPNITCSSINNSRDEINKLGVKYAEISIVFAEKKQQIQMVLNELLNKIKLLEDPNCSMQTTVHMVHINEKCF